MNDQRRASAQLGRRGGFQSDTSSTTLSGLAPRLKENERRSQYLIQFRVVLQKYLRLAGLYLCKASRQRWFSILVSAFLLWWIAALVLCSLDLDSPFPSVDSQLPTHSIKVQGDGYLRIGPFHQASVYGDFDDFRVGRSCHWRRHWFCFFVYHWDCRDCGTFSASWKKCKVLPRRGKCDLPASQGWNDPWPARSSLYNSESSNPYPVQLITSYGVGKVRKVLYEQPECPLGVSGPCWDLNRCRDSQTGDIVHPLPIYTYSSRSRRQVEDALTTLSTKARHGFEVTNDAQKACLLFVNSTEIEAALHSSTWNNGQNHFVYGIDRPPPTTKVHYGMAALGTLVATQSQLRWGFDIPIQLPAIWHPSNSNQATARKLLLTFRGTIQDTLQPYYQQRWIAAEYLYNEPKVDINVQCKHKTLAGDQVVVAPYDDESLRGKHSYGDMMEGSVFGFCPGGSHANSYRFTEVLSAGGIPILLPESVTPFTPEVDWSHCVVRVSQARIVDLPRILAAIGKEEIERRQTECQRLFERYLRNGVNQEQGLGISLEIWRKRLKGAIYSSHVIQEG